MPLSIHWRLTRAVDNPSGLEAMAASCREAERSGIDSILAEPDPSRTDPMTFSLALARATERIRFLVTACPGRISPTLFVQQVNTFSAQADGRIALCVEAGDSPDSDDLSARADEFLTICRVFWDRRGPVHFAGRFYRIEDGRLNTPFLAPVRTRPEIYVGGDSPRARALAARHGDVWLRSADTPERIAEEAVPAREAGVAVAVRLSGLLRPTRDEAEADLGGTPREVADRLLALGDAGVSGFLLSGVDDQEEMLRFGREVLPLLRKNGR